PGSRAARSSPRCRVTGFSWTGHPGPASEHLARWGQHLRRNRWNARSPPPPGSDHFLSAAPESVENLGLHPQYAIIKAQSVPLNAIVATGWRLIPCFSLTGNSMIDNREIRASNRHFFLD